MTKSALIVVDCQVDFVDGKLVVPNATDAILNINEIVESNFFPVQVATADWHPHDHCSFADNGGQWPKHCVAGSRGAEFHELLDADEFNAIIRKGCRQDVDSYSGFVENDKTTPTGLAGYLHDLGVSDVYVCGLALDYCVSYTAADAVKLGFKTFIIRDACAAIDLAAWTPPEGVTLVNISEIPYDRPSQPLDLDRG